MDSALVAHIAKLHQFMRENDAIHTERMYKDDMERAHRQVVNARELAAREVSMQRERAATAVAIQRQRDDGTRIRISDVTTRRRQQQWE
jgi:hypothetical protein